MHLRAFLWSKKSYKHFSDLLPNIAFFIYDHQAGMMIHEDSLQAGYVDWTSDKLIKAINRSKEKGGKETYYFNVKKRQKEY